MKKIQVNSVPGFKFRQDITNGTHSVVCDLDIASGGNASGLDPKDHTLGGLGACTAMTIKMVADYNKWQLDGISVKITQTDEPDPADTKKKQFVVLEEIEIRGNLSQQQLDKLKAAAKGCPVYKLMTGQKRVEATLTQVSPPAPAAPASTNAPASATTGSTATVPAKASAPSATPTTK